MIAIRPYLERDWEAVCRVHDRAQPSEFQGDCTPRILTPLANNLSVHPIFQKSHKFVACEGENIVGFVAIYNNHITLLYVDPDYQHRGIGKRLLRLALNIIGSPAWTVIIAANLKAHQFYEKAGFQENSRFEGQVSGFPLTFIRLLRFLNS